MAHLPIALQLYTVRDQTDRDFSGTVRQVAQQGYEGVEFAGYGALPADEMKALLDETGLQAAGTHVGLPALDADLAGEIDYCLTIGCRYLIVPWLDPGLRRDVPGTATRLNAIGQHCKDRGLSLGYHNHDWEFASSDGPYFMDRLLDATDPQLVSLELDIGWAAHAGVDPVSVLHQWSGRVPLVHVKDFGRNREAVNVGEGDLDFGAILPVAREAGARWYIVENESRVASLQGAQRSLQYLQATAAV